MSSFVPRREFLVFGKPVVADDEMLEVMNCLRSGWVGRGPRVSLFEEKFKEYVKAPFAAAVSSCTAGLHLAMVSLNIKPGDEVLVPALTFAATANSVVHAGGVPVFVDCDPITGLINLDEASRKVTSRTRGIIPVHLHGRPVDMIHVSALAKKHGLFIIEDAAHAIETQYHGHPVGTHSDLAVYSFYSTKNISTVEGGMVTSRRQDLIDRVKVLCSHGLSADAWSRYSDTGFKHYYVQEAGFKYNLTDLQASLGIKQLEKIEGFYERRRALWGFYQEQLKGLPLDLPANPLPWMRHAFHLYTPRVQKPYDRDQVMGRLRELRIGTGVHYLALPRHPYYQKEFGVTPEQFPGADDFGQRTISLPFNQYLSQEDAQDVVAALRHVFS